MEQINRKSLAGKLAADGEGIILLVYPLLQELSLRGAREQAVRHSVPGTTATANPQAGRGSGAD